MNHDPLNTVIIALLVKSVAYLGLALAIYWLLRRRSAATQSQLLRTALAGLLVLSAVGLAAPSWMGEVGANLKPNGDPVHVPATGGEAVDVQATLSSPRVVENEGFPLELPAAPPLAGERLIASEQQRSPSWLVVLWISGAVCCMARFLVGWIRMVKLRVSSTPAPAEIRDLSSRLGGSKGRGRNVAVRIHPEVRSPLSFGTVRPVILLPAEHTSWPEAETRMVLKHELAHIRRFDSAFLWLGEICRALFWMNPLAWVTVRQLRLADECAADDDVLRSGCDPEDYAGVLLTLARKAVGSVAATPVPASIAMAQPSTVRMRIGRILDSARTRRGPGWVTMLTLGALCAAFAVAIGGGTTATAQDADVPDPGENEAAKEESASAPRDPNAGGFLTIPPAADGSQLIIEKLRHITLPSVQFENATLKEVMTYFRIKSRELDRLEQDPKHRGINFIIKAESAKTVTLDLQNVPLVVALKAATDLAGARYRIEPFAVVISSHNDDSDVLWTRVFQVQPTFLSDSGLNREASATEFLQVLGVTFPEGTSAHFIPSSSLLVVRNTAANMELLQTYLEQGRNRVLSTLAVSVEIYALAKTDALKLMSEHGDKADVSALAQDLRERINGETVRLIASPHFVTRSGLGARIESGEKIEYVAGYVERDGRDTPVHRSVFAGTSVEVIPALGADRYTMDARILVTEGLGVPRIEKQKTVAPVSGKEVEVSSVRLDELTLNTVTTIMSGQTKLVGIMNPPPHVSKDEAHVVFLKIKRVDAWEEPKDDGN